jgi:hypothetical protein
VPGRVAIRRLSLRGLAPRDHPAPGDLERRLADAARALLPAALAQAIGDWSQASVLRIRRLEVDITLDAAAEPEAFAALLARAIAAGLRRAEALATAGDGADGIVCYATRASYLAALLEALAERRAAQCWWLRDADGLRFLSPAAAIRTAVLADAAVGLEALASLPPARLASVLRALDTGEADRVLDGLAATGTTNFQDCVTAIATAAAELQIAASPLALYLRAAALRPGIAGSALAGTARVWVAIEHALDGQSGAAATATLAGDATDWRGGAGLRMQLLETAAGRLPETAALGTRLPESVRRALAGAVLRHRGRTALAKSQPAYAFTQFGGLLLLVPSLGMAEIAATVAEWPDAAPDTAALIAYAALGMCAGRARFAQWLGEPLWRELFGLDMQVPAAAITERLAAIEPRDWATLVPLGAPVDRRRDTRFLLAPRGLAGSRAAAHTLAVLARAASSRFARRLAGFGAASAPFLWANLLGVTAVLERRPGGWSARLSRPPLDVLLSFSRIAEGSVELPSGVRVAIARTTA